jgi:uncharacterized protein (TIGR03086 family)
MRTGHLVTGFTSHHELMDTETTTTTTDLLAERPTAAAVPTSVSSGLSPDDPRLAFASAVATAGPVIDAVRLDQMTLPTPCADFDVRALLGHLEFVLRRIAAIGRDEDPFSVTERHDVPDTGWLAAWIEAAHEVQAAWTDPAILDQPRTLPWMVMPGRAALAVYTSEVVIHTWDLARATGQHPVWDDDVVALASATMEMAIPSAERPAEVPFADAVSVPADASAIDRLVSWTGRRP